MRTKEEILQGMDEVTFLLRCQEDFKFFAERALGLTSYGGIHEFQLKWIRTIEKHKATVIEAFPNASKTEIVGVAYPLWYLIRNPCKKVLLISKAAHQSKTNLLSRLKDYITENEVLKEIWAPDNRNTTWNNTQIKLKDNSLITIAPYSINVRSYRGDVIICDEADSYEETDTYFSEVTTRLNPGGRICLISTPKGPNRLIGVLKAKRPTGYVFIKTAGLVDSDGNPKQRPYEEGISIWPERFPTQHFLDELGAQGETIFALNYLCNTEMPGEDAIFDIKSWFSGFDDTIGFSMDVNPDAQYFIGVDLAISNGPKADYDAYVVIERLNEFYTIKWIETHKGWKVPTKVNRLEELYRHFTSNKTTRLIVDKSQNGTETIRQLRARGITTVEQSWHSAERQRLYVNLSNVIDSNSVIVPRRKDDERALKEIDELTTQLMGFVRKVSDVSGNQSGVSSKASHDDIAAALAMAISEASKMKNIGCLGMSSN